MIENYRSRSTAIKSTVRQGILFTLLSIFAACTQATEWYGVNADTEIESMKCASIGNIHPQMQEQRTVGSGNYSARRYAMEDGSTYMVIFERENGERRHLEFANSVKACMERRALKGSVTKLETSNDLYSMAHR